MIEKKVIKVEPTRYDGIPFRSRSEARWAFFFNEMKVGYEYEPDRYNLGGKKYLVDFWIPDWDIFIEVKNRDSITDEESEKCRLLSRDSGKGVFLVNGQPGYYHGIFYVDGEIKLKGSPETQCRFMTCGTCYHRTTIFYGNDKQPETEHYYSWWYLGERDCGNESCGFKRPRWTPLIVEAIKASKGERFEPKPAPLLEQNGDKEVSGG